MKHTVPPGHFPSLSTWAMIVGVLSIALLPTTLSAKERGLRLELGPNFSFSKFSDGSSNDWNATAFLGIDGWVGPFGLMLHAKKGTGVSQVELTDAGLVPTVTYTSQFDIGPTANFTPGPLHCRLGLGPWFGNSVVHDETLTDIQMSGFWMDWSQLRFMGLMAEGRLDLNIPILSPFAIVSIQSQNSFSIQGQEYGSGSGDYRGRDVRGTLGARLNVIPFVKLGIAGTIGQAQHVLETNLEEGSQTWRVVGNTYGISVWAVVVL